MRGANRHGTDTVIAEVERIVSTGFIHCAGIAIIRSFAGINLIGMDIVEVAPAYDHSQITALAAAHIACDLICLYAKLSGLLNLPGH